MAKFTTKNIEFKNDQKAIFGTNDDSAIYWDGTLSDMRIDTTISGVTPTQGYHLTTKQYVDQQIGGIDEFIELTDTPSTYVSTKDKMVVVKTDESGLEFTSTVSGTFFGTFSGTVYDTSGQEVDHSQYTLTDGSRPFISTIAGVDPVADNDLVTKGFLETGFVASASVESILFGLQFHFNVEEPEQQTISTSYIEALRLTVSGTDGNGIDAGTYRIGWNFNWTQTKLNQEFIAQVQIDDTDTIFDLSISPYVDVGYFASVTGFFFSVLTSGTHYVDIDFATSDSSSTSRIKNIRLEFWRVA